MKNVLHLSLAVIVAVAASSAVAALAAPPNMSGTWSVQQSGLNGNTTSTVKLAQSGMGLYRHVVERNRLHRHVRQRHADQREMARSGRSRVADRLRQSERS